MMKKTVSAPSLRPDLRMRASADESASGACKARGIPAVCAATAKARRISSRAHEPAGLSWEQLRSGLQGVLAELSVDGAQAQPRK